jgi:dihydrofolate reductase
VRKMFSFMMTSADGYHAGPGQALDWHNVDQEFSQFALAQQATWAGTRIISDHVEQELAKLKQQPGQDIVIPGSSTLTAGLLQTGLLDELRIMVNAVILGQGRSLFAGAG